MNVTYAARATDARRMIPIASRRRHRRGMMLKTAIAANRPRTSMPNGWYIQLDPNIPRAAQLRLRVMPQPGHGTPVVFWSQQIETPVPWAGWIRATRSAHQATTIVGRPSQRS